MCACACVCVCVVSLHIRHILGEVSRKGGHRLASEGTWVARPGAGGQCPPPGALDTVSAEPLQGLCAHNSSQERGL